MGVCIHQIDSKFLVRAANKRPALEAAARVHGHWIRQGEGESCDTLEELLELWGYEPGVDDDGNIVRLHLTAEKLGAEHEMFKAIAPFVEPGSFLKMGCDHGGPFKWTFDGATCIESEPIW